MRARYRRSPERAFMLLAPSGQVSPVPKPLIDGRLWLGIGSCRVAAMLNYGEKLCRDESRFLNMGRSRGRGS